MTYLQLVQKAIRKSGAKLDSPSTIIGATGLVELFREWVNDAWKEIQLEHLGWNWRVTRDLTLNMVVGTDEYAIPSTLETIEKRNVSIYDDPADESPVCFINYHLWRGKYNPVDPTPNGRPRWFTITPNDMLAFYPPPDDTYSVRYDGLLRVDELNTASDADTPVGLFAEYHDAIVWRAVMYYAQNFEDGSKLAEAEAHWRIYKKYFEEREQEDIVVDTDAMYSPRGYSY